LSDYIPPFEITQKMLFFTSSITEKITQLVNLDLLNKKPYLRKQNHINSIHSSLAIENNNLSIQQVKDVIDGKTVVGPLKEIQEVKNIYKAYELIDKINPYSIKDLKKIHSIITYLTVDESGKFRTGNEGVFDGNKVIFLCPPPNRVPLLINDLFARMKRNKKQIHPLILSSVFHYEFVFIHPFSDGNGRTARLWQNLILYNWKNIFQYIPIESKIYKYQNDYYNAIDYCNKKGNSTKFIEFILKMIDETLNELLNEQTKSLDQETININLLLNSMEKNVPISANNLMKKLKIKSKNTLRNVYLKPAIKQGLIKLTNPDKPSSCKQMYYKDI